MRLLNGYKCRNPLNIKALESASFLSSKDMWKSCKQSVCGTFAILKTLNICSIYVFDPYSDPHKILLDKAWHEVYLNNMAI